MSRQVMLASMDSQELTAWQALFAVQAEELEHKRDLAESGDGIVKRYGHPDDEDDGDEPDHYGETE